MNPDGGSDAPYNEVQLSGFLNAAIVTGAGTSMRPNLIPFAGTGKNYIYSGIAVRIRLLEASLLDRTYQSLPSSQLEKGNLIEFKSSSQFTTDFLNRMKTLERIAKMSGLRLFVVGPDTETCTAMASQMLSACDALVKSGYRLKVTPPSSAEAERRNCGSTTTDRAT